MILYFLDDLLKIFKIKFDFTTYLLLKCSFEDLKNQSMISNCLYHLFTCLRSIFARNDCLNCSRVYIKTNIFKPKNFNCIADFKFNSFFNSAGLSSKSLIILKNFNFVLFF